MMGDFYISAKVEVKDRNPDAGTSYKCLQTCILNWHVIRGPRGWICHVAAARTNPRKKRRKKVTTSKVTIGVFGILIIIVF
jgi:hypothetical protein